MTKTTTQPSLVEDSRIAQLEALIRDLKVQRDMVHYVAFDVLSYTRSLRLMLSGLSVQLGHSNADLLAAIKTTENFTTFFDHGLAEAMKIRDALERLGVSLHATAPDPGVEARH